ncbi:MAG: 2Fe-2S iron-sulfur cluster binding domain-containing protein [Oscillospiraceae bacterium]|jgi:NADP-reducing hydrogenase subunit HndD|nr:2Fe-2S iron-sulfur cluster binding domain-containing protein [Oscillospiraceae bacterium]MCI8758555.1 2Fe-2S iron-sulfur cluster binding domain-containing protein [Oscillospiraceae bacterium]
MVKITINGAAVEVQEGATILEAAKASGFPIPSLCYWKGLNEIGACRVCVVEVEGVDRLVTACDEPVHDGMVVYTNSPRVRAARRTNLRLILSQHDCQCAFCTRNGNCSLQKLAMDANLLYIPYPINIRKEIWDRKTPLIRQESKCIKCMRCIQVCDKIQDLHIWDLAGTGSRVTVNVSQNRRITDADCAFCGQCVTHCPTAALRERDDTEPVLDILADGSLTTVVQVAPAVRVAWAEEMGLEPGPAATRKMVAALKRLGFHYVFDTNFAADLTIMEEGSEFVERFTHRDQYQWPMFTSCCPGWVRFVKSNYPEFTANLSTAKSPQQMFGAVAKSYFAEKMGLDPHKMRVVSIMPCLAKKAEAALEPLRDACGDPDVDVVLTTRELVRMVRADKILVENLPEEAFDSPLGTATGAAVVFGATGGVMDAALRSAYYLVTGRNPNADTFRAVRGMDHDGWKEAAFNIPGAGVVRVAVVSSLGRARKLMEAIRRGDVSYDFVEVMACPGGCAGGGGQPIVDGEELAEYRGDALWDMDKQEKIRFSHENSDVQTLYREYMEKPCGERAHHLLHTDHSAWQMPPAPVRKK